jgi:hypothetical protein
MKENLTARYNLDMTVGEKPVMNVDDLYIVLNHHWTKDTTPYPDGRQLIQLAFLLLVSAYTGSRPGALVYVEQNERTNLKHFFGREDDNEEIEEEWDLREDDLKTLCYGQISLILLPNPGGIRDHLVMEIDLKHTKGHHSKPKRSVGEVPPPILQANAPRERFFSCPKLNNLPSTSLFLCLQWQFLMTLSRQIFILSRIYSGREYVHPVALSY